MTERIIILELLKKLSVVGEERRINAFYWICRIDTCGMPKALRQIE